MNKPIYSRAHGPPPGGGEEPEPASPPPPITINRSNCLMVQVPAPLPSIGEVALALSGQYGDIADKLTPFHNQKRLIIQYVEGTDVSALTAKGLQIGSITAVVAQLLNTHVQKDLLEITLGRENPFIANPGNQTNLERQLARYGNIVRLERQTIGKCPTGIITVILDRAGQKEWPPQQFVIEEANQVLKIDARWPHQRRLTCPYCHEPHKRGQCTAAPMCNTCKTRDHRPGTADKCRPKPIVHERTPEEIESYKAWGQSSKSNQREVGWNEIPVKRKPVKGKAADVPAQPAQPVLKSANQFAALSEDNKPVDELAKDQPQETDTEMIGPKKVPTSAGVAASIHNPANAGAQESQTESTEKPKEPTESDTDQSKPAPTQAEAPEAVMADVESLKEFPILPPPSAEVKRSTAPAPHKSSVARDARTAANKVSTLESGTAAKRKKISRAKPDEKPVEPANPIKSATETEGNAVSNMEPTAVVEMTESQIDAAAQVEVGIMLRNSPSPPPQTMQSAPAGL